MSDKTTDQPATAAPLDPLVSQPVCDGNDVLEFLVQFEWWEVRRSNSGSTHRIVVAIRKADGEYVKVHGRVGETVCGVTERLRLKVIGDAG